MASIGDTPDPMAIGSQSFPRVLLNVRRRQYCGHLQWEGEEEVVLGEGEKRGIGDLAQEKVLGIWYMMGLGLKGMHGTGTRMHFGHGI